MGRVRCRTMRLRLIAFVCVGALLASGCSGDDDGGPPEFRNIVDLRGQATGTYPEVEVAVKDNSFAPAAIRIDPGTTVVWKNDGRNPHDILKFDPKQDFNS